MTLDLDRLILGIILRAKPQMDRDDFENQLHVLKRMVVAASENPTFPLRDQTACVTLGNMRIAALFFDRVWADPVTEDAPPSDIAFFRGTQFEALTTLLFFGIHFGRISSTNWVREELPEARKLDSLFEFDRFERAVSTAYSQSRIPVTPMYDSSEARDRQFRSGDTAALLAAVEGMELIDSSKLTWAQVAEFRQDREAKQKLRRMRNWLSEIKSERSIAEVSDLLCTQLESYEWSLKKHGILTVAGTMSDLLDPKVLSATGAVAGGLALAGGAFWAAVGAAGLLAGKAIVSVTKSLVDLSDRKRTQGSEVAFVHEIKKLTEE